jgi:HD superfamily phosphohydrolase
MAVWPSALPSYGSGNTSVLTVHDPLWGELKLDHPLLQELAASRPVQRLRGISMAGASRYLYPEKPLATRFEHSVGVMHLLRKVGASLDEQVAGLLHDVPHTAFSHTVDNVFPSDEYNYHERFQHEIIMRSEIPSILAHHSIGMAPALHPDSFPLLEQPLPDLCADRIDYALRDLHASGLITIQETADFVSQLLPTPHGLVVSNVEAALWFSNHFLHANDSFWTGPGEAGAYWALAGAIRRAYEVGTFTHDDLFSTDDAAMQKLRSLDDTLVQSYLALLAPGTHFYQADPDGLCFVTHMKQRTVDPLILLDKDGSTQRLSDLSIDYSHTLQHRHATLSSTYRLWSDAITPIVAASVAKGTNH